jgi:hypothetical protein
MPVLIPIRRFFPRFACPLAAGGLTDLAAHGELAV